MLNLAPTTEVEVHLIVDSAEVRLGEGQISALLEVVAAHLPVAAAKRHSSGGRDAAAEAAAS